MDSSFFNASSKGKSLPLTAWAGAALVVFDTSRKLEQAGQPVQPAFLPSFLHHAADFPLLQARLQSLARFYFRGVANHFAVGRVGRD